MTRLRYWLTAKTQYNIHSPFIFDLYNDVLFAQVGKEKRRDAYSSLVFKFAEHFGLKTISNDANQTIFEPSKDFERLLIVNQPHCDAQAEKRFESLSDSPDYNVVLDLYDAAVLFSRPSMHAQKYLLK